MQPQRCRSDLPQAAPEPAGTQNAAGCSDFPVHPPRAAWGQPILSPALCPPPEMPVPCQSTEGTISSPGTRAAGSSPRRAGAKPQPPPPPPAPAGQRSPGCRRAAAGGAAPACCSAAGPRRGKAAEPRSHPRPQSPRGRAGSGTGVPGVPGVPWPLRRRLRRPLPAGAAAAAAAAGSAAE